jgi:hypothetical protein
MELQTEKEIEDEADNHTGYSFSTHSEVMEPDEKKYLYTKSVINVTKRTLARYLIMNKCVCLFMLWIHLTMALLSVVVSYHASVVLSESQLCRYIFYASHYFYGYIHLLLAALYLYLFASFSMKNWDNLKDNGWLAVMFLIMVAYVVLLKVMSDAVCTFWSISLSQIVLQGVQFGAEGLLLKMFYSWLYSKSTLLRETLEHNVDFISADHYTH